MAASPIPPSGHIPPAFLQTLVELEKGIADVLASEKNANKKMAAGKSKAVSSMRQSLKKKAKEFELLLKTYNEVSALLILHTAY
jgi:translation initiation factor 3 subunit C